MTCSSIRTDDLANLLKEARGERSLREVEAEIGISISTLSRIERGLSTHIGIDLFLRICDWLEISPCALLQVNRRFNSDEEALLELRRSFDRAEIALNFILKRG